LAWYKKGSRTRVKVKLGFENFYLYSSVNPQDGRHFTLLLPWVNTDGMNLFIEELSKGNSRKPFFDSHFKQNYKIVVA
jgi:hypothetical protein